MATEADGVSSLTLIPMNPSLWVSAKNAMKHGGAEKEREGLEEETKQGNAMVKEG